MGFAAMLADGKILNIWFTISAGSGLTEFY